MNEAALSARPSREENSTHTVFPVRALRSSNKRERHWAMLEAKLIGTSVPMRKLKQSVAEVAGSTETVLITGESGTGKELIARAIHDLSSRHAGPYVAVNCGALTESLLESELFGHMKGSFTGATANKKGFFEAANSGTLFLDEFAEMSLSTQQRLLRVLQERTVRPIGCTEQREITIDTRVLVATNHDLERDVAEGKFRRDLYYRVNVLEVYAPPLKERADDIPLLARHFIRNYNQANETTLPDTLDSKVLNRLQTYAWPGNVRELENTIKRLATKTADERGFLEEHLIAIPAFNRVGLNTPNSSQVQPQERSNVPIVREDCCCKWQKELAWYRRRLDEAGGNIAEAARHLNIPRTTFRYRMKALESKCHI